MYLTNDYKYSFWNYMRGRQHGAEALYECTTESGTQRLPADFYDEFAKAMEKEISSGAMPQSCKSKCQLLPSWRSIQPAEQTGSVKMEPSSTVKTR